MNNPIFVGYYTRNTPYEKEYEFLALSLRSLNLEYDYLPVESKGSWLANCGMKAGVIEHFLAKYPNRPIVYIDVDSLVLTRPELFWNLGEVDLGAVMFQSQTLLSGVMAWQANERTLALVSKWKELAAQYPKTLPNGKEAWDQRLLAMALEQCPQVRFEALPPSYNFMIELSQKAYPALSPVILATRGALRLQEAVERGNEPITLPRGVGEASIWLLCPSARSPQEANPVLAAWRERGYRIAAFRDTGKEAVTADEIIYGEYSGYANTVNLLCKTILAKYPSAQWVVAGNDDMYCDKNKTASEIGKELTEHFGGTFGVCQSTGDKYGAIKSGSSIVSPFMGREWCERINGGNGPLWGEYFHYFEDSENKEVALKHKRLWEREDLTHYHNHFERFGLPTPPHLLKAKSKWKESQRLFLSRKAEGFPGSDPLPSPSLPSPIEQPIKGLISFSLFGNLDLYNLGAVENMKLASTIYPNWKVRFYVDPQVTVKDQLKAMGAEIIEMPSEAGAKAMSWRFLAAMEKGFDYVVFRDCDSRLNPREKAAVDSWISSGKTFHIMRDHLHHAAYPIFAGMWGCKGGSLPRMASWISQYRPWGKRLDDMKLLTLRVLPLARSNWLHHTSVVNRWGGEPFPSHSPYAGFVGETILL